MLDFQFLHPELHPEGKKGEDGVWYNGTLAHWEVARAAGLEPTTYGLEDRCSIH